jgi:hypothetical protein
LGRTVDGGLEGDQGVDRGLQVAALKLPEEIGDRVGMVSP